MTQERNSHGEAVPQAAAATQPGSEPAPASDLPADLAGAFRKLLAEKQEIYDRLLRKHAELENLRKRSEREKEELVKHASADLIRALLPALDSFERALKHRDPRVPDEFYKGVELIHRELVDVLGRAGLEPLETKGRIFDPHLHQAVETLESGAHRDQEIVEELQRGYKLKHRLLRPAIVKVAVAPKELSEPQVDG
ncbi:MAG TPA: nucleotide exchange factor GrpE [Terriglobia bacterium]|nr:nucleotide exchange factor GrpE [Terriglobia bacterium]